MITRVGQVRNYLGREGRRLKLIMYRSFYVRGEQKEEIVDNFHRLYYDGRLWGETHGNTQWLGTPIYKCPMDMVIYQEIIHDVRPDVIIETGTMDGGSALFMASICDLVQHGKVITIDIVPPHGKPQHDRLTYLQGSSTSPEIFSKVQELIGEDQKIMVVLDSDHTKKHVLEEMELYHQLVPVGSYLIVEDTNMNGHPVAPEFGPGPMEACKEFLQTNDKFIVDKSKEKLYLSFNPDGYLKRIK